MVVIRRIVLSLCLGVTMLLATRCYHADPDKVNPPSLYLPDDLEATLWAESPMFYNPTNMDIDAKGRVWVTEAVNYRNYNNDSTKVLHHASGDRVMILEDTDHDGKADLSKVFVQDRDLVSPLGITVIGNKVIVACSPNLIIYTDTNGDDKPDKKEIFLTGFGGKDHDHSLHAVVEGPDGNWYFNTGNAGPHIVKDKSGWTLRAGSIYTGGSPYNIENQGNMKSDDGKVWVGGLALRIRPDGTHLKVMAHNFRNSYESFVDSHGDMWQNDNDDQVVACRTSWLMEGGNAGYFSTDGTRFWQGDQRPWQDIFTAHWHQDDPGIMPAGDRSGAGAPTGIVVNEEDALGEKYRGLMLSADAGRNVVFGYHPVLQGAGYKLGTRSNFITSLRDDNAGYVWNDSSENAKKDKWFRPSDVAIGTDGAIYVADWYDPVVGGHQMQDSLGYGRIYRIAPKTKKLSTPVYNFASDEGLIEALKSPAVNVRASAFNALVTKGAASIETVSALLNDSNPYHRARAIWVLANLGEEGRTKVQGLLEVPDVLTRATAFRALRQVEKDILPFAKRLSSDSSAFVRREVVASLRDLPFSDTKPLLLHLMQFADAGDRWYSASLAAACVGHEDEVYRDLLKVFNVENKPAGQWDETLASLVWSLCPPSAVGALAQRATSDQVSPGERGRALTALAFINTPQAAHTMVALSKSTLREVADQATYWISFRQSNDWYTLIDWKKTGIDTEYQRTLSSMKVSMGRILDERLPFNEKKWNAQSMARSAVGGQMLMGMVSENKLPKELFPVVQDLILQNPNLSVRVQAEHYFKKPGEKSFNLTSIIGLPVNVDRGQTVFNASCATCHRVRNIGHDIGPELTAIGSKFDRKTLLEAIVDPSAGIVFGYEPWTITTKDGESFFGFLVGDNETTIVIKDLTGHSHVIGSGDVATRTRMKQSIMPSPVSLGLSEQDLADVSEFLISTHQ